MKYKEIEERLKYFKKHKELPPYVKTQVDITHEFVTVNEAKRKIQEIKDKFQVNGISEEVQLKRKQKIIDEGIKSRYAMSGAIGTRMMFE